MITVIARPGPTGSMKECQIAALARFNFQNIVVHPFRGLQSSMILERELSRAGALRETPKSLVNRLINRVCLVFFSCRIDWVLSPFTNGLDLIFV